ncbi:methionine ABC transporter ATP-binding protein [Peptoniphilus equinus]|uniref:Methionine ABC transporter ATP-binding protein n=1 Tax=Peptoniphilus equinus TaxID=3016343 RepID=A0ABY7QUR1_9FIRM|nr:methionine ABC transporter ATP-binding protein [Peptoniphilus equinus]WBW49913.1 methionine ABC transporter ATP-binding protein [Peptoniphilus equinus]
MIELSHVSKTFQLKSGAVHAVKDVSLTIADGEIFGVIGYSGAGKSTLVRCINVLERPTEGTVAVDGVELTALNEKALRRERTKIGMIFQQFNLYRSRTVFDNVAFALRHRGLDKGTIQERVDELLELVGISDKKHVYPSQLSGGQKQRVAIARALASRPKVLLCDEATSALDPQTTKSILDLLKTLNRKLGITIVVITHEMAVIKDICHRVAVMEDGKVVELNDVVSIFSNPKAPITKDFINSTSNLSRIHELIKDRAQVVALKPGQKICRLDFTGSFTKEAIISQISREFDVDASIIFASVETVQDTVFGSLIIILNGNAANHDAVFKFLQSRNITTEVIQVA